VIKVKIATREDLVAGAVALLLDENNRILLLLRPDEARWAPNKWGYPGGKIEDGETPLQAATRETKEETDLNIKNLQPLGIKMHKAAMGFYTRDFSGDIKIDHEHKDWAWVSRQKIEEYEIAPDVLEMFEWVLNNE
jgi:8-oxo-dGTP diphosphatase